MGEGKYPEDGFIYIFFKTPAQLTPNYVKICATSRHVTSHHDACVGAVVYRLPQFTATFFNKLFAQKAFLKFSVPLNSTKDTTRPRKSHEKEGVEYHFVSKQAFEADAQNNR